MVPAGPVDIVFLLVKLEDCGGLSIYLCIEDGAAVRTKASIDEKETTRNPRLRPSAVSCEERCWRCGEGRLTPRQVHVWPWQFQPR